MSADWLWWHSESWGYNMKIINIPLPGNAYPVVVGHGALAGLADLLGKYRLGTDAVIISNPKVFGLHGRQLQGVLRKAGVSSRVLLVADSEKSKSMATAVRLIDQVVRYSVGRKCFIVAFGGGVTGDLAGFVAAVTKRGLPFVQVPTTFLAQIDSSIGGKVAVDLPAGKNLVGAFYHPRFVLADTSFLATLSGRQIRNGLAEAVKYGIIADARLFSFMEKEYRRLVENDLSAITPVVSSCAAIKARIVAADEKETRGLRTILNFGHTIGHAIETTAGYTLYQHGEAVALGMRAAASISVRMKLLDPMVHFRIETLLSAFGLPESIEGCSLSGILSAMRFDKKFSGKTNRFVLARDIGDVVVQEGVDSGLISAVVGKMLIRRQSSRLLSR